MPEGACGTARRRVVIKWPHYFHHRDAKCFKCGATLRRLAISGMAPGHGQYRGDCQPCGATTWYDCAEGSVELIDLEVARGDRKP